MVDLMAGLMAGLKAVRLEEANHECISLIKIIIRQLNSFSYLKEMAKVLVSDNLLSAVGLLHC